MITRRTAMTFLGASALLLASTRSGAAAAGAASAAAPPMAGNLDLSGVEIIDSHMHPVRRMLISQAYAGQMQEFSALATPPGDYPGRDTVIERARQGGRELVMAAPRRTGYFNYIARTYGVPPTVEGFDSVTSRHIGSDTAFTRYITSILDREKIATVVLQAAEPAPAAPVTLIPADRHVWTTVISDLTRAGWARERGLTDLHDVLAAIDQVMQTAVERGCRGFKNMAAYYRPLALSKPSAAQAQAALGRLLASTPSGSAAPTADTSADAAAQAAARTYEDYLFWHIYARAGQLERPIIIHTAVALHPSLRIDFNDPRPLYAVFSDADMQRAGTRFVLIHAGYPSINVVAAFISQFANVYTDVSFYSKYPGVLLQIYRSLLALGPSNKIMHGSDANSVPEEIGYCAWNTRAVLAKVLTEYRQSFGWTQADITTMAEDVMHRTARRLYRISA